VYVHLRSGKLSDRGAPAIFVGFPAGVTGWSVFNPRNNRVFVSRDVKFLENRAGGPLLVNNAVSQPVSLLDLFPSFDSDHQAPEGNADAPASSFEQNTVHAPCTEEPECPVLQESLVGIK
jgi:hypothetical protein